MKPTDLLDALLAKTARGMSAENRRKTVEALRALSLEEDGVRRAAAYLMKFHYSVCLAFAEEASASGEDGLELAAALADDGQFAAGKPGVVYPKGFSALLAFARGGKHRAALLLLGRILKGAEKGGVFSPGCLNGFKKYVLDQGGLPAIRELQARIEGKSEAEQRAARFLRGVCAPAAAPEEARPDDAGATRAGELAALRASIEPAQREILAALRQLTEQRGAVDSLTALLSRKEGELASVRAQSAEGEGRVASLESELRGREGRIADAEARIAELTEQLRGFFQRDGIAKNQELATLKNEISEALKPDYEDFLGSRESPYGQDLFEAYRAALTRIFKWLRKYGILCQ